MSLDLPLPLFHQTVLRHSREFYLRSVLMDMVLINIAHRKYFLSMGFDLIYSIKKGFIMINRIIG